jgi:hypothetical protein
MNLEKKKLQMLYAWSDFYVKNEQHEASYKVQEQIKDYKLKHNIK